MNTVEEEMDGESTERAIGMYGGLGEQSISQIPCSTQDFLSSKGTWGISPSRTVVA